MNRSHKAVAGVLTAVLLTGTGVACAGGLGAHSRRAHATLPRPADTRAARSVSGPVVRRVPPLRRLTAPDAVVTFRASIGAGTIRRLHRLTGLAAFAVADAGSVVVAGTRLHLLGVNPARMRGFTPGFTARSRPLWTSIVRGELTVDYSLAGRMQRDLGAVLPASGHTTPPVQLRVGAFATVGLGGAEGLVDRSMSAPLGLVPQRVLVLSAPRRSEADLRADLRTLFPRAHVRVVRPQRVDQAVISAYARARIPAGYLRLYRAAASTCRGLPWTVLAAIGTVETGNGADTSTSSKGAMGPMQFLPSTFVAYAVDGDGDGVANILDPADAIFSAARYLCAWGAGLGGRSLYAAVFAYNHADWYVREVIRLAIAYS
jgi:hypothetical protein